MPPETTLRHAMAWAKLARIRTVRDITAMDCLGVPIFVSERPGSATGAYAFGKGGLPIESEVGAYMEAIESYFSEPGVAPIETRWGLPSELSGVGEGCDPVFAFAPKLGRRAEPDQALLLARAEDADSGADGWIPAELAFNPAPDAGMPLYGASSNGLASGNSVLEASIHALYELIERDIWSIEFVRRRSVRVTGESLPGAVQAIVETAARNGLRLVIRFVPNDYCIPFFAAFLVDPTHPERRFFNGGWGCHDERGIALMRAVTEVAQSRVAVLHGLREPNRCDDPVAEADRVRRQIASVSSQTPSIRFDDVPERPVAAASLAAQWATVSASLRRVIDRPIYRVIYTPPDAPLHVVRLVVPLLEHFSQTTRRIGPRLQAELEAHSCASAAIA
ncbi:YcaO-like family protein [Bradyrhizobium oligotrophicum]|uniref:YcaO-like family protein n=1 Tax=Bradyrhizobium oligotrophicum TaxID=44255 RepID=UPI001360B5B7|nr:YcaO-like family protein [Bradyrhizobium oligotrophicum]